MATDPLPQPHAGAKKQLTLVGRVVRQGNQLWVETGSGRFVLEADAKAPQTQAISEATDQELTLSVQVPETLTNPATVQLLAQLPPVAAAR